MDIRRKYKRKTILKTARQSSSPYATKQQDDENENIESSFRSWVSRRKQKKAENALDSEPNQSDSTPMEHVGDKMSGLPIIAKLKTLNYNQGIYPPPNLEDPPTGLEETLQNVQLQKENNRDGQ